MTTKKVVRKSAVEKQKKQWPRFLNSLKAVGVAGLKHGDYGHCYPDAQDFATWLPAGTRLVLKREKQNLFDSLAILIIEEETGKKVGYVPSSQNATLARLMDAGYPLYGAILTHDRTKAMGTFERITVAVYIETRR